MVGPSFLKHEKDLKTLETTLIEVQNIATRREEEYKQQVAALTQQLADMGK